MQRRQWCSITFNSYEQDFKHIIRSISDKLEGNGKEVCAVTTSPHRFWQELRKAALRKVELELDEADDIDNHIVHSPSVNAHKNINLTVLF
jgi:hypothetical protein